MFSEKLQKLEPLFANILKFLKELDPGLVVLSRHIKTNQREWFE